MNAHPLEFRPMLAGDAVLLSLQPSQHYELGVEVRQFTIEDGAAMVEGGPAWTAHRGSRIVGIAGFRELFAGHAVAWSAISEHVGADHLACTRFARQKIAEAPFRRIEAIVAKNNARAVAWAKLVGLEPAYELRGYGASGETCILFEKVNV